MHQTAARPWEARRSEVRLWRALSLVFACVWIILGFFVAVMPGMVSPLFILAGAVPVLLGVVLMVSVLQTRCRVRGPAPPSELHYACSRCGYGILDPSVARCPECGDSSIVDRSAPSAAEVIWWRVGVVVSLLTAFGFFAWVGFRQVTVPHAPLTALLMTGLLLVPLLMLLVLPPVVLQVAMLGHVGRWRILVGLVLLALSISLTAWPYRLAWVLHQPAFDRLHDRASAGETIALPRRIGLFEVREIDRASNGVASYWMHGSARRRCVRVPDGVPEPPYLGIWSALRLGGGWWHHVDE